MVQNKIDNSMIVNCKSRSEVVFCGIYEMIEMIIGLMPFINLIIGSIIRENGLCAICASLV